MNGQPAPKIQELADKINLLFTRRRKPNIFEIRPIKAEIEILKGKAEFVADYYSLLGTISALENNKLDIIKNYENALKYSTNIYKTQINYINSLFNAGFIFNSLNQSEKLFTSLHYDEELLINIIENTYKLCCFNKSLKLLAQCKHPEKTWVNRGFLLNIINIFNDAALEDAESQHLCELAYSVLEIRNLYFSTSTIKIVDDCIIYTIYVDLPVEQLFDVNWELSGIFAKNVEYMRSDVLMFEYSSIDILEEEEAYERLV